MNSKPIIGYILLAIGLIIIGVTLWSSYAIFTDKSAAPLIFKPQVTAPASAQQNSNNPEQQMQQAISKQMGNLVPPDALVKMLNLISWSILAGILVFGGGQVAGIGIRLIS